METSAKVTSKGQITIPKAVRDALEIEEGDVVIFRVTGRQAVVARSVDFIDLAGVVEVPLEKHGKPWGEIRDTAQRAQFGKR